MDHLIRVSHHGDEESGGGQHRHHGLLVVGDEGGQHRGIACAGVVLEPRGGQVAASPRQTGRVGGGIRTHALGVPSVIAGIGHGVTRVSSAGIGVRVLDAGAVAAQDAANITIREK